jgi:hypothetical protein
MQVVDPAMLKLYTDDHPTGVLAQRYLFVGDDNTPENFMFSIAENRGRFQMVRHRHSFDQFRFSIKGDLEMGNGRKLRENCLGYFPEGTPYGPQDDQAGPVTVVLQFGGSSGCGYLSPEQYRAGRAALNKVGRFEGPVFIREMADGTVRRTFSINAIWEEALGARMLLPAPRYDQPIFIDPAAFRWIPVKGAPGAWHKPLGTFSEREVRAEVWKIEAGATLEIASGEARRLMLVLDGAGRAAAQPLKQHFGIRVEPGEQAAIAAEVELTLLSFHMPPVNSGWIQPSLPSFEPVPGESVQDPV